MLTNTTTQELAVRLYENKLYGSTYGKGLYRRALFNGSIDVRSPQAKFVIDLYTYDEWLQQARTEEQREIAQKVRCSSNCLYSWIYRYNPVTKQKSLALGFIQLDLNTNEVELALDLEQDGLDPVVCSLNARPCKASNDQRRTPQLLATNADLTLWE
jgi:hypothetical protein